MPAILLVRVKINDPEAYKNYVARSGPAVAAHGGRFIVRGSEPEMLEGANDGARNVIVEFPDIDSARRFYKSAQYAEAKSFRAPPVAEGTFMLFETAESVGHG